MFKRKSNLIIDTPNKRVRPAGEEENEDADDNDSDQEDLLLSNQVIVVVDKLQNVMLFIIKHHTPVVSVNVTNVTLISSGAF